jgi:hypothetical protein
MDYGARLKKQGINPNRKRSHYTIQGLFEDVDRQLRAAIIKLLLTKDTITIKNLIGIIGTFLGRAEKILISLKQDVIIIRLG